MNAFVECGSSSYLTDHTNKEKKTKANRVFNIRQRIIYFLAEKKCENFQNSKKNASSFFSVNSRIKASSENFQHDSRKFQLNSMNFKLHIERIFLAARHEIFSVRNDESKHVLVNNVLLWFIRFDIYTLLNYASTREVRYDLNAIIVG